MIDYFSAVRLQPDYSMLDHDIIEPRYPRKEVELTTLGVRFPVVDAYEDVIFEKEENDLHYSMVIEWSEADQAYLVTLPEWADRVIMPATHGSTYGEAIQHGQEVLAMLVNSAIREGEPLPPAKTHALA